MGSPSSATPADGGGQTPQTKNAPGQRAESPRPPDAAAAIQKAQAEHAAYLQERETRERRSVLRGLILLAIVALLVSLLRAGVGRAFYSGWWRQW